MIKATLQFKGTEALVQNLAKIDERQKKAVEAATKRCAAKVVRDAKFMCPVDTGRLRASLTMNWTESGLGRAPLVKGSTNPKNLSTGEDTIGEPKQGELGKGFFAVVGTNVNYSEDVEDRSPYLWPAFAMHKNEYKADLEKALRTALEVNYE
jgi:hypothetical protein